MTSSVNRREGSADRVLFLRGVAIEDMLVGHLEFALCHEGVNLEAIDALFEHLPPQDLLAWLNEAPNGAHIRRVCHLWEWLTGQELPAEVFRREARSSCFLPTITSPPGSPPTTASSACATTHWERPISPRWCGARQYRAHLRWQNSSTRRARPWRP